MSAEQEIQQGKRAELLLSDLQPYFDMVESAILLKWKESPVGDKDGQHELRLMMKLLKDLQANIVTAVETGKMAQIQLERESLMDKAKNVIRRFA